MTLSDVLGAPVAFQRSFVYFTGSVNAALMLSQVVYWSTRTTLPDRWFYKTQGHWERETGLTRREQDGARRTLVGLGVVKEEKRGVPARLHFQLQEEVLWRLCFETASKAPGVIGVRTETPDSKHQTAKRDAPKRQTNTETKAETTQRVSADAAATLQLVPCEVAEKGDLRHTECLDVCRKYAEHKRVAFVWDGSEAKQLGLLLKASPELTVEQFATCVRNRARSAVAHGERPRVWLPTLLRYQGGALDRFGIPEGEGNGADRKHHAGQPGAGTGHARRTDGNIAAAQRVYEGIVGGLADAC